MTNRRIRVLVNGCCVVGKRIADAITVRDALELVGVTDVVSDWRINVAVLNGCPVYVSTLPAADETPAPGGRATRPRQLQTMSPTCDETVVVGSFIRLPVHAYRNCREPALSLATPRAIRWARRYRESAI